jgi:protocatechuate 3,4-dioxygenase beta subunit
MFAAIALIFGAIVCAPAQSASTAASTPRGYRIAGRVVDSVTGEPVPRAIVNVVSGDYQGAVASAVTGTDGRFSLENIPAGKYPLNASRRGYRSTYYDEHEGFNSAIVTGDGLVTDNLEFHLAPAAVLAGVVTDDAGEPVESAQVMLFKQPDANEGSHMKQAGSAQTDDTGAYEFAGLPAGEYVVGVNAEPWYAQHRSIYTGPSSEPSPLDVAYPVTFYDSTIDESAATPIKLEAGSREQADIHLHAVPALHFRVPSSRRNGDRFFLQQRIFGNSVPVGHTEITSSGDHGLTEISGIAPGTYEAEVGEPPRHMVLNANSNQDISLTGGIPTVTVSGTLTLAGGGLLPPHIIMNLVPLNGGPQMTIEAAQGRFLFEGVLPGEFTLGSASADQTLAVVSTSTAGVVNAGGRISVGDQALSLSVTLTHAEVKIQGFARTGQAPAPGAMILLVPDDPRNFPALVRRDQSDSDGSFELLGVAPGAYKVIAIEDGWNLDWQDPHVLARYLSGGLPVTVSNQSGPVLRLARAVSAMQRLP